MEEEGANVISALAKVLERLIDVNDKAQKGQHVITKFQSSYPPDVTIYAYLERIRKYARCSDSCFIIALIYIDRMIEMRNVVLSHLNIHRILITSVLLAAKFIDDLFYNNAYYARLGGISTAEINSLELELLHFVGFSLNVSSELFIKYQAELKSYHASTKDVTSSIALNGFDSCSILRKDATSTAIVLETPFPALISPLNIAPPGNGLSMGLSSTLCLSSTSTSPFFSFACLSPSTLVESSLSTGHFVHEPHMIMAKPSDESKGNVPHGFALNSDFGLNDRIANIQSRSGYPSDLAGLNSGQGEVSRMGSHRKTIKLESSSVTPPSFPGAHQIQGDIAYQFVSYQSRLIREEQHLRSEVENPCERQSPSLQKHLILSKSDSCASCSAFPDSDDHMNAISTVDPAVRSVSPLSPSSSTRCHHMFNRPINGSYAGGQYIEDCVHFPQFLDHRVNSSKPEAYSCTKNTMVQNASHPFQLEMRRGDFSPEEDLRAASGVNIYGHGNLCSESYVREDDAQRQWHGYQHDGIGYFGPRDWHLQCQRIQHHGINQGAPRRTHKHNYHQPNGADNWAPPRKSAWDLRQEHGIYNFSNSAISANQHCFIDGEPRVLIRHSEFTHQHIDMIPRCPVFQQHCQKLDHSIHSVEMPKQPPLNFFYGDEEACDKSCLVPQANVGRAQPVDNMSMYLAPYVECERV